MEKKQKTRGKKRPGDGVPRAAAAPAAVVPVPNRRGGGAFAPSALLLHGDGGEPQPALLLPQGRLGAAHRRAPRRDHRGRSRGDQGARADAPLRRRSGGPRRRRHHRAQAVRAAEEALGAVRVAETPARLLAPAAASQEHGFKAGRDARPTRGGVVRAPGRARARAARVGRASRRRADHACVPARERRFAERVRRVASRIQAPPGDDGRERLGLPRRARAAGAVHPPVAREAKATGPRTNKRRGADRGRVV